MSTRNDGRDDWVKLLELGLSWRSTCVALPLPALFDLSTHETSVRWPTLIIPTLGTGSAHLTLTEDEQKASVDCSVGS